MNVIEAIIFGLIQGLSEFLPISSSGHLVLAKEIMHLTEPGIAFEIFVHLGTVFSILVVFRKEVAKLIIGAIQTYKLRDPSTTAEEKEYIYLAWYIIIGSIPAGVIGFTLKDQIESLFTSGGGFSGVVLVTFMLYITGIILFLTRYAGKKDLKVSGKSAFIIGIAQAFAILPGISRSGSTIATGLLLGIEKERAAKFSFLLSLPVIIGATLKQLLDMMGSGGIDQQLIFTLTVATVSAFISGYFAIQFLLDVIRKNKLEYFAYYCWLIATASLIYFVIL